MFSKFGIAPRPWMLVGLMVLALGVIGGHDAYELRRAQARHADTLRIARQQVELTGELRWAQIRLLMQVQEFKNVLLRAHDGGDHEQHLAQFRRRGEQVMAHLVEARRRMRALGMATAELDEAAQMHQDFSRQYLAALVDFRVGQADTTILVDAAVRDKDRPLEQKIVAVAHAVDAQARAEDARRAEAATADGHAALAKQVGLLAAMLGLSAAFAGLLGAGALRPGRRAARTTAAAA